MSLVKENVRTPRPPEAPMVRLPLADIPEILGPCTVYGLLAGDCTGISLDSRQVRPGIVFAAIAGSCLDGTDYIPDAIRNGAIAILGRDRAAARNAGAPVFIEVGEPRRALARLACALYGHPSRALRTVGVTGTNGKSTVSLLTKAILSEAGYVPGLIGTLGYDTGGRWIPPGRTTPESPELQRLLHAMTQAGCDSAVMEVSSHALAQDRVYGVKFDVRVFTNLSEDHLDYHTSMENYFQTKSLLFDDDQYRAGSGVSIVNLDDPWGRKLTLRGGIRAHTVTYGFSPDAQVRAERVRLDGDGCAFLLRSPWGEAPFRIRLLGRHNIGNALAAAAASGALGIDIATMVRALETAEPPPGRLERIDNHLGISIYVDYAHTEDALIHVLKSLRDLHDGRLTVVFGCGGDRDRAKRPCMGAAAARWADRAVATSDNPRGEDPAAILREIIGGCPGAPNVEIVEDRRAAIRQSLQDARPGDVIVVAGKGHETTQQIGPIFHPFDDREVIRDFLRDMKP